MAALERGSPCFPKTGELPWCLWPVAVTERESVPAGNVWQLLFPSLILSVISAGH